MSKANKAKGGNRTVVIAAIGLAIVVAALLLVWRTMGPAERGGRKDRHRSGGPRGRKQQGFYPEY